jgi:hypothetical protein
MRLPPTSVPLPLSTGDAITLREPVTIVQRQSAAIADTQLVGPGLEMRYLRWRLPSVPIARFPSLRASLQRLRIVRRRSVTENTNVPPAGSGRASDEITPSSTGPAHTQIDVDNVFLSPVFRILSSLATYLIVVAFAELTDASPIRSLAKPLLAGASIALADAVATYRSVTEVLALDNGARAAFECLKITLLVLLLLELMF